MPKKSKDLVRLAKLVCTQSVIIYGRNENGDPDKCFEEGKEYLFCVDEKKGDLFTFNDVKQVHFLGWDDYYTDKHFKIISIGKLDEFDLDELALARMKKLYKDRYDFSE